jgi:hypothetical protein
MQDVHVKLNAGLPSQQTHSKARRLFITKLDLNVRKKLVKCCIWSIALYGTGIWIHQKDQKYLGSFKM